MVQELEDNNAGGPFAVPDFWKSSACLDFTVAAVNEKNPLFSVDFTSAYPIRLIPLGSRWTRLLTRMW
jgi:hypothetical protein